MNSSRADLERQARIAKPSKLGAWVESGGIHQQVAEDELRRRREEEQRRKSMRGVVDPIAGRGYDREA